jgi:hypothetical protein
MNKLLVAFALLLSSRPAAGSQFALPVHVPPSLYPQTGSSFEAGLGWQAIRGPGLALEGPGGRWEYASVSKSASATGHVHADAFLIKGEDDPLGAGRRHVSGMTGSLEADLSWAPKAQPLRFYTGGLVNMTSLSFSSARAINYSNGLIRVEPDTATSLVVGVPIGVNAGSQTQNWALSAGAHGVAWLGGGSFFSYGPAGPLGIGRSRKVHPNFGGGGNLRVEYIPWRLALQSGLSANAGAGNNDPYTAGWANLTFRFF